MVSDSNFNPGRYHGTTFKVQNPDAVLGLFQSLWDALKLCDDHTDTHTSIYQIDHYDYEAVETLVCYNKPHTIN